MAEGLRDFARARSIAVVGASARVVVVDALVGPR
jgi:hypothetical protein